MEAAHAIKQLRLKLGLTQRQFADLVGVLQPTIARAESDATGNSITLLRRIAKATGTTLAIRFE